MAVDYLSALNTKGSGLNITQIVDSLVEAEIAPQQDALNKKIEEKNTAISALGELVSELSALKNDLASLEGSQKYAPTSATTSIGISVTDNAKADTFSSDVRVTSLATSQTLEFTNFAGPTATLGTGSFAINFGTWADDESSFTANGSTASLTISSSNATLAGLASSLDAISGINAKVVAKGDSNNTYSLIVQSELGKDNAIQFDTSVTANSGTHSLTIFDNADTENDNVALQVVAANDATLIVDGVTVNRETNSIDDLFDGYTLAVSSTTTGTTAFRVSAAIDTDTAITAVKSLVSTINTTRGVFSEYIDRDESNTGVLASDPVAKAISKKLRALTVGGIAGYGSTSLYLAELGVQTNRDGTLSLNETTLKERLALDATSTATPKPSAVFDAIFNSGASSDSPFLKVLTSNFASATAGSYAWVGNSSPPTIEGVDTSTVTDTTLGTGYLSAGSNTPGVKVFPSTTVNSANIFIGKSLMDQMADYIDGVIASSGDLEKRKTTLSNDVSDFDVELFDLESKLDNARTRYMSQFSAMESSVTSLKSTGEYLTNMIDSWNSDS
jgi:flagellar hook-associated protein 2